MLTLDAVRTAVFSDQPWTRLDEIVRAELAAGRTTRQIYKSLMALADEIDATPDLPENGSDAFGDVLDALTGFCRPECQYKDPPNVTLPTDEEIEELPRWARVAFAARCARRVLPLFRVSWPDAPDKELVAVTTVIEFTERAAAVGEALAESAEAAAYAATKAAVTASVAKATAAQAIARCATRAAQAIGGAAHAYALPGSDAEATAEAVEAAIEAAIDWVITPDARRDFDYLSRQAEAQRWDDNTSVPPEVFGPLWPEGPPKGWPPITDVPQRAELVIEGFVREQTAHRVIVDDVVNLFHALNRYHITRSGERLTLDQFHSLLPALVPAEV
ncbi:MAG TPA: hypothetical protein VGE74_23750 [Gemmata sp.]